LKPFKTVTDYAKFFLLGVCLLPGISVLAQAGQLPDFTTSKFFSEQLRTFKYPADVSIHINAPCPDSLRADRETSIILFALPNGNSTEWTIGKEAGPSDDWHYEIQHIGAQTRFLRQLIHDRNIVTVYLETDGKSWPSWRSLHGDQNSALIIAMIDSIRQVFKDYPHRVTLSGHSGGGSMSFGFFNGVDSIPNYIDRITFLDSDYAYSDAQQHGDKLAEWLLRSPDHYLCVLAYNDSIALFEGNPVVSPTGGTWYRSKMMQRRLAQYFPFTEDHNSEFLRWYALDGRVKFYLKENPNRIILHTVQVERNGFIHVIVSGTQSESVGYEYYGPRAYEQYIEKLPPENIESFKIERASEHSLRATLETVPHGEDYCLFISQDGVNFNDSLFFAPPAVVINGLDPDSLYFFQLQSFSPWGLSPKSEVLAGTPGPSPPEVLIVNSFDRNKVENTRDFIRQHARAFQQNGYAVASVSNNAMLNGMVQLQDYHTVDYIIGDDVKFDETFGYDEQALIQTFLDSGGCLFATGSELGYDLDYRSTDIDKAFCRNYLKLSYVQNSPLNQISTYYEVQFDSVGGFGGLPPFRFDNGSYGTYDVNRPDAIKPVGGGLACLHFVGVDTADGVAGVCYSGKFSPEGQPGKVIALTVPFETIISDSMRTAIIERVMDYFAWETALAPLDSPAQPRDFTLLPNFPNPFNPSTTLTYELPQGAPVAFEVFNLQGERVATLLDQYQPPGRYQLEWNANDQPSGIYCFHLSAGNIKATRKGLLLK
jgi:hypothetical protein